VRCLIESTWSARDVHGHLDGAVADDLHHDARVNAEQQ
jgi:hypothetical protein